MNFEQYLLIEDFSSELEALAGGVNIDITKHFVDRIKERKINPTIIIAAIKKFIEKYGSKLATDKKVIIGGVLMDITKQLNIPLSYKNKGTPTPKDDELSLITIMQKAGFIPNNPKDQIFKV